MLTFLLLSLCLAADPVTARGELVLDARLPAEVLVDGTTVAKLFRDARLTVDVPAGVRTVRVYTNGSPEDLEVVVPANGSVEVLVGRTGLSVDPSATRTAPREVAVGDVPVQIRMSGPIGARLVVDNHRYEVAAGAQVDLELSAGDHVFSVRNEDGTVVWASGTLKVEGPEAVVVQLSEGRMPEVSGRGAFASRK